MNRRKYMNKRIISLMLAVVMLLSSVSICCGAAAPETDFFESDYMAPRWMIALIFAEIFDYDESRYIYENAREYKDVPEDAYYAKAVSWMGQTGILGGTGSREFSPYMEMSRGMVAYIMTKALTDMDSLPKASFADVKTTDYFTKAVGYVVENGLMDVETVNGKKYFYPNEFVKISDFAAFYAANAEKSLPFLEKMDIGEGFTYTLDLENSTLVVHGNGKVEEFGVGKLPMLAYYAAKVKHIVFDEGITDIDVNALVGAGDFDGIFLPSTLQKLNNEFFHNIDSYREIYYGGTIENWDAMEYIHPYANHLKEHIEYGKIKLFVQQTPHIHTFSKTYQYAGDANCKTDGTERAACSVQDCAAALIRIKEGSKTGHIYENYVVNRDATRSEDATETSRCKFYDLCSEVHTRTAKGTKLINTNKVFKDLSKNGWYLYYVDYAYTNKLFSGTSKNTFEPETYLSRGMFVTVLSRISGAKVNNNATTVFKDVKRGKWYTGAVAWAYENGIVNGLSKDTFGWNQNISREQLCTMLVRYADYEGVRLRSIQVLTKYEDWNQISPWAVSAVERCLSAALITGEIVEQKPSPFPNMPTRVYFNINPGKPATRAQASKILSIFHRDYATTIQS